MEIMNGQQDHEGTFHTRSQSMKSPLQGSEQDPLRQVAASKLSKCQEVKDWIEPAESVLVWQQFGELHENFDF